jgi:membrane protein DedA with SNARE-associated domain
MKRGTRRDPLTRIRASARIQLLAILPVAAHLHLHLRNKRVHGPPVDYAGVLLASAASWFGLPGPGEAALVAGGVFASHGRLNLGPLLFYAWLGASGGGAAGWLVGRRAGRAVITAPGPLLRWRLAAVRRSESLYRRFGVFAVFLTPSWGAGVARMSAARFLPANALSAACWALLFGLGSYLAGPSLTDTFEFLGVGGLVVLVGVVVGGTLLAALRSRRGEKTN